MRRLWERLETYFAAQWPNKELKLRPPATPLQIAAAEKELGVRFPDDFRESLQVHDGQDDEPSILWLPGVAQLGSLESMVQCWKFDRQFFDPNATVHPSRADATRRVQQSHLHPKHISFAGSPHWDYDRLLFDFEPSAEGSHAQVILRFDIDLVYLTDTWRQLMEITIDGLENGTITMIENGEWMSYWLTPVYRSPRAKKPIPMLEYFKRTMS